MYGFITTVGDEFFTEIENALGKNGYTPKRVTDKDHGLENVISIDLKDYLDKGYNILRLRSANEAIEDNMALDTGNAYAILEILGYLNYEGDDGSAEENRF